MIADAFARVAELPVEHVASFVVENGTDPTFFGDAGEIFALASVTKLFSAFACLVAMEEGTIGAEDPAGPPGSTVAHLLSHASGLSMSDPSSVLAPPATRRIYSNVGFDVLADHVAQRAAMTFVEYLDESLFAPLSMRDSSLVGSPASGAHSSAGDLARFASELLSSKLLAASTLETATTVVFPGLSGVVPGFGHYVNCDWGLGFELKADKSPHWTAPQNSPQTFGHFGQAGSFLWVDPAHRVAFGLLSDRPFGEWAKQAWPVIGSALLAEGNDSSQGHYASAP